MVRTLRRKRQSFVAILATGAVYSVAGVLTLEYPPEYLANSGFWAVVFIVAGWTALMTLVYHRLWLSVFSGALLVGSAIFRSAAIFVELGWHRWLRAFYGSTDPMSSSFSIAGMTWLLIALLLWIGWPQLQAQMLDSDIERVKDGGE